MKKILRPEFVGTILVVAVILTLPNTSLAADKKDARVTAVIKDVKLLTSKSAGRPAAVNDNVNEGTAVRTGTDSRAELTFADQTLTRLGANTVFSYGGGAREFDLAGGAVLMCVPKEKGAVNLKTVAATAAVTGGITMAESHAKSSTKIVVLEGEACVKLKRGRGASPGDPCLTLHAGEMLVLPPGATRFTEKKNVNLRKLINTSGLIHKFSTKLPNWIWTLILTEADNQQENPPSGGYSDPSNTDAVDQRNAIDRPPKPRPIGTPPGA